MRASRLACGWLSLALTLVAAAAAAEGFQAVYSKNGSDVWAVGDAGVAWRSFDGGATWASQTLGTKTLHGVAHRGFVVITVADDGEVQRSTDNGGAFTLQTLPGAAHLRAIEMVDAANGWIVGDGGAIFKTADGGLNWAAQTSGTPQRLNTVRFRNSTEGWAAGAAGTVLHTADGGSLWTPVSAGTSRNLRAVDYVGAAVWVVGDYATAVSTLDGAVWTPQNLKLDAKSNVTGVWMESALRVTLTGGGGFIRKTTDGGDFWSFQKNPVLAESSDIFFTNGGTKGWAVHPANRAVSRTTDSGITWTTTATETRSFVQKLTTPPGFSVRGNSLCSSGQDNNTIFCVLGLNLYRSTDRGETWVQTGTISGGGSKTNAFYVHPNDDNLMVVAVGAPDRIMRSTNGGATWTQTLAVDFTEYGVPLELNVNNLDKMLFGPEDTHLYSSNDFGATWTILSTPSFRSPCDIQIVPDNDNFIWVGDGVTGSGVGQMFRSTNGGLTFQLIYSTTGSEVPMIGATHLAPNAGFATHWSSGGCRRTTDFGLNWIAVAATAAAWGCDYADDDPNVVSYGTYGGGQNYLSLTGGASGSFVTTPVPGANYAMYMPDRATVFSLQGDGVYKMSSSYAATATAAQGPLTVLAPNGGEVWTGGTVHAITWSSSNLGLAKIEYRPGPAGAWQQVALVDGQDGAFNWTVPFDNTAGAEVRVSDAWDANPADTSNLPFAIQSLVPAFSASTAAIDFGLVDVGTTAVQTLTISNPGTAPLSITAISSDHPEIAPSVTSLTVPAAGNANLDVTYAPLSPGADAGTLTFVDNAPGSPHTVGDTGEGRTPVDTGAVPAAFGLAQDGPNPFRGTTSIRYRLPRATQVLLEVFDLQGRRVATLVQAQQAAGEYRVAFGRGQATVGGRIDDLAAGVYFVRLKAGADSKAAKIVLAR